MTRVAMSRECFLKAVSGSSLMCEERERQRRLSDNFSSCSCSDCGRLNKDEIRNEKSRVDDVRAHHHTREDKSN